jgi:hypothetical protein
MSNVRLGRYAFSISAAAALLVACGGGIPTNSAPPEALAPATLAAAAGAPGHKRGALLYVSTQTNAEVYVFTYPRLVLQQKLTGFSSPEGLCVDAKGDVFVTDGPASDIVEYAHGGTVPIATLQDPGGWPFDCTVDPTTGDLAVTNAGTPSSWDGDVVLYPHARGSMRKTYSVAQINDMWFCGYDSNGNLFVDGDSDGGTPLFAELSHDAKMFTNLRLDQTFGEPGPMQWDGTYLAIGNPTGESPTTIYRFAVSGSKGTTKGVIHLDRADWIVQFWIAGPDVTAATENSSSDWAGIWKYPAGGNPIRKTKRLEILPFGVTISN